MISYFTQGAHSLQAAGLPRHPGHALFRVVGGRRPLPFASWARGKQVLARTSAPTPVDGRIVILSDGTMATVRGLRQGDRAALLDFLRGLSPWTCTSRGWLRLDSDEIRSKLAESHFRQQNLGNAGILVMRTGKELIGVSGYHRHKAGQCELVLTIADRWQNRTAGRQLRQITIDAARNAGFETAISFIWNGNEPMLKLARERGFTQVSTGSNHVGRWEKTL